MNGKRNWLTHPTSREVLVIILIWLTGSLLSLAAATDLFSVNPLTRDNLILNTLNLACTVLVLACVVNYFRHRKKENPAERKLQ